MSETILKVEDLKTSFMTSSGEVQAVRGVSFEVHKGEILGIVGESGSGKSVTSMSILRLLADTARIKNGKIEFEGTDLTKVSDKQMREIRGQKIAMVFQDPMSSLNPLIPVGKQVAEMIHVHHPEMKRDELQAATLELFREVRIPEAEKRLKSYPHEFSGGMRQRVMIAMALANHPDLLIADEPTTALDVTIQHQILKQMRSLQEEYGTSIIFITHDLGVVAELCDRVVVLYGGLVMEEAEINDLFENPLHPYTMGLLASIPGLTKDKSERLQSIPGSPPDMTKPPKGCPFASRCQFARNICAAECPPFVQVGSRQARCWLLQPDAPAEGNPLHDSTGTLVPGNAESWDISDDGLTYTFHLRDGLKWSDGSDLTAEDYVYTIQRVLTPATAAQYVSMATDYIKNAQEYYDGTATADDLGVKALDDKTLEITLIQPTSYFIDILSMWTFSPVQKATVEANGDKWSTEADTYICNGPFKIASMSMNENVILEKNENYWDAENVSLQKVTFRYVLDQATALTAYESGEVDGVASIPSSDFARLKAENAGVQTSPSYGTVYYDFNCSAEPVNNVLVRKAICLAIDRQSIIDNVVQVDAQPAYSFLAPGYSVDGKDITEGRESFGLSATADVEGAQAALAEAGYPNGEGFPTLTLSYYDNDTVKKVVEAMAEMLKNNLNINVEVSSNEWSIFYDDVQKGNYQVAAMGWSADYVNPMSFLPLCKTGDSSNNLFYSNADYDALVEQVKAENDPAKAAELTLQADAIVSNDYAVLPLYYKSNNYLMHDNISGFYMTASGNLFFKDVKVG